MNKQEAEASLIELSRRPEGVKLQEVSKDHSLWEIAEELVKAGKLHKAKLGHKTVRYFADKRMADALQTKQHQFVVKQERLAIDPNAEMIITEKTKITICPSPSSFHVKQLSGW